MCVYKYIHIQACIHTHTRLYTHVYVHIHICTCTHTHMYAHTYVYAYVFVYIQASLVSQSVKKSACNSGDLGSVSGLERSPGEGNVYPLQYSCLKNPMDQGGWWAIVHRVAKIQTQLRD